MEPRFIQIHTLTSYPGSLLNRDDAGFAKRLPFGGASRIRISSQCLKRHWRSHKGAEGLSSISEEVRPSVRSRHTFDLRVMQPLIAEGHDASVVRTVVAKLMESVLGQSAKKTSAKKKKGAVPEPLKTGQITVLGEPEIEYLKREVREICKAHPADATAAEKAFDEHLKKNKKELAKNLAALGKAGLGLDGALFGRMVTSDYLARGDAAIHVAHAFTVHAESSETDYFSAVDDLLGALNDDEEEALGAGHIGTSELTSGLFYGYVIVDVPLLVSNVEGCPAREWKKTERALSAEVVRRLVQIMATVSPGAKLGSTAPHAYAHLLLVEAGDAQPRTLANAFLAPIRVTQREPDLLLNAYAALGRHVSELDRMYGRSFDRRLAGIGDTDAMRAAIGVEAPSTLSQAATWAAEAILGAK